MVNRAGTEAACRSERPKDRVRLVNMVKTALKSGAIKGVRLALIVLALMAVAIAATAASVYWSGGQLLPVSWHLPTVSLSSVGLHYDQLRMWVDANFVSAVLVYVAAYFTIAVLFLPGSALMVVVAGLLFGAAMGAPLAWVASVVAAGLAFVVVRQFATVVLATYKNLTVIPTLTRLKAGFGRHAFGYVLFLRLSPGLPFALVNAAPALLDVRFSTFLAATALGFVPSRIALSTAGAGLSSVIKDRNIAYESCLAGAAATGEAGRDACAYGLSLASLLTTEMVAAFVALAALALVPVLIERVRLPGLPIARPLGAYLGRILATRRIAEASRHGSIRHADAKPATDGRPETTKSGA